MKTRRLSLAALCIAACLALLLAGCFHPGGEVKRGALTVSITNSINARTLLPSISMDAASYTIQGTGPNEATFSKSSSGEAVTVEALAFGTWTVTVNALNDIGTIIGQGEATATLSPGQDTTLAITVVPLGGTGDLNLTVTWAASLLNPSIQASLMPFSGDAMNLDFGISGNLAGYSGSAIPAGYYTLTVQLMENGFAVMGAVEAVRIVSGQTTSGTYDFTNVNRGTFVVNITPELANPLPVSISGVPSTVATGTGVTASAGVSDATPNVTYVWYLNGAYQDSGQSCTFGSALGTGYYRLDVMAFTADGKRAGSATASFQVVKAIISVAGYWDITITLEGQQPMPPELFYIQQTGSVLEAGMSPFFLSGSIDGANVTLTGQVQQGTTITTVTFKGTVSGSQITGTASAPGIGQGTFVMVPAALQFGHLQMQGNNNEMPLSLYTLYAFGQRPTKTYGFGLGLNLGTLNFETRSAPSAASYTVSGNDDQPGSIRVSVWQNDSSHYATGGMVDFTRFDNAGAAGTFSIGFSDGSGLSGTFDLVFGVNSSASVQGTGMWSAIQAAVPTFSWGGTTTSLRIAFLDSQLKMELGFGISGELHTGDYAMPMTAWLGVQWRPRGAVGPDEIHFNDLSGTLHISSVGPAGVAGSFETVYSGGALSGDFDVSF